MAVKTLLPMRSIHKPNLNYARCLESSTGTYKFIEHDLVYKDATYKKLRVCGADPTAVAGLATHTNPTAANTNSFYEKAEPNQIFIANVYTDGNGSSTAGNALLETDLNVEYGVVKVGNNWHIDKTETSNKVVRIVGKYEEDDYGDYYGRAKFVFLDAVCQDVD